MRRTVLWLTLGAAAALGACTESRRANSAATFGDQPAEVACWSYAREIYRGRSTGKVEYHDSGRISFVDATTGSLTSVEGDCRVVYLDADDGASAETTPPSPTPPSSKASQTPPPG